MLNRKTPDTLAVTVSLAGQGENSKEQIVFFNRTEDDIKRRTEELTEAGASGETVNLELFCYTVKSINGNQFGTAEVAEMEARWPGTVLAIFTEYHKARRVEIAKN